MVLRITVAILIHPQMINLYYLISQEIKFELSCVNGTQVIITLKKQNIHGPTQNQTLIAEVTGLENKRHKVIIRIAEGYTKGINLDAIDIDANGILIHPDTEGIVESLKLNKETLELTIGSSETLVATIEPENAINKNVIWTSSDSEIASVDDNGNVIGKKAGKVTITVETTDGSNLTATAEVTVKETETGEIGTRAILRLTVTNKDIHEYDLSLSEIDQFMNW